MGFDSGESAVALVGMAGFRSWWWWWKQIWCCPDPDCGVASWTDQTEAIAPRASMTERARAGPCRQVGEQNRSVAYVARDLGVGWSTVMAVVSDYGRPFVDDADRLADTNALGFDEIAFLRANATRLRLRHQLRRPGPWAPARRRRRSPRQRRARLAGQPQRGLARRGEDGGHRPPPGLTPTASPSAWATPAWWSTPAIRWRRPTEPSTTCAGGCRTRLWATGAQRRSALWHPPPVAAGHRTPQRRQSGPSGRPGHRRSPRRGARQPAGPGGPSDHVRSRDAGGSSTSLRRLRR